MPIEACRAGKDVYVEKSMSYSIAEGRAMADAVKKYDRVLQVGNMQRSWRNFRHASELVRYGYIGPPPVKYNLAAQSVPKTLNWDMWVGPAGPVEYIPADPRELRPLTMYYSNGTIMTHEPFREADGNAVRFIGTDGVIDISRSFLDTIPAKLQDVVIGENEIHLYKSDDHYTDFLDAMKTRKQPLSTVEHRGILAKFLLKLNRKRHLLIFRSAPEIKTVSC